MGQLSLHLKTFLTNNTQEGEFAIFPENINQGYILQLIISSFPEIKACLAIDGAL
jgi:hypothetical protein